MAKKVLIVYAHQSSGSFNAAAKDAAVDVLTAQGCTVEVSDLYAMKFKATATIEDITGQVKNAEHFRYAEETKLAWEEGKLSADITEEQLPMYWFTVPAIMKGWFDRVLTLGFAYSQDNRYSLGIFKIYWAPSHIPRGLHPVLEAWGERGNRLRFTGDGESGTQVSRSGARIHPQNLTNSRCWEAETSKEEEPANRIYPSQRWCVISQ
ncbi:NAD(P)H dehydrogenase [quinone] [Lates japonicus]|uniref:NAD(P)H dehydrogenase [quinone] n=1 Tax=Lates japonicus TaxID=270547 RepID=A0AAD3N7Y9_LATJO|nr:NAD(P)H dehydrogenase [quinone] [Lates japonicus]